MKWGLGDVFLYVGVFGALGGMCRYAMNLWLGGGDFPSATLAVNLIGCFYWLFLCDFWRKNHVFHWCF